MTINNSLAHEEGNKVLQQIFKTINSFCVGLEDFTARYHGLRFLLLLNDTSAKQAYQIGKRLNKKIEMHHNIIDEHVLKHSINIGFYTILGESLTAEQFVKKAQKNVYINNQNIGEMMLEPVTAINLNTTLLSIRENEVAILLLKGMSNLDIAAELFVSETTVKKHVSSIFNKLDVHSRAEFIAKFNQKPI